MKQEPKAHARSTPPNEAAPLRGHRSRVRYDLTDEGIHKDVAVAQLSMVFERMPLALAITIGVCVLFFHWASLYFPVAKLVVLFGGLIAVSALRFVLWRAWTRARHKSANFKGWDMLSMAASFLSGVSWGMGPLTLIDGPGQSSTLLLVSLVLCFSGGTAVSQSPRVRTMMAYMIPAMGMTAVALFRTGGGVECLAGLLMLLALLGMIQVGRVASWAVRSGIENQFRLAQVITQLDSEKQRAQAASVAKTRFLANMSHELRSPLSAVISAAELLQVGGQASADQARLIAGIHQSGSNLLGLIENIMDLSRIEAGALTLADEEFDLAEAVQAAFTTAQLTGSAKGLAMHCNFAPGMVMWRRGDASRVRQVLLNLLGNAVKFTPSGSVELHAMQGETPDVVLLSVADTGIGIPAEALDVVFEPFRQADEEASRRFGGSGLGLTIVHQVVQAMKGYIEVHSEVGQGTRFDVALPLPLAPSRPHTPPVVRPVPSAPLFPIAPEVSALSTLSTLSTLSPLPTVPTVTATPGRSHLMAQAPAKLGPPHVLVVEDHPLNRSLVCQLLQKAGCTTMAVEDGHSALSVMSTHRFDLVLMDWQMPGMDGLEVTRRLRDGESGLHGQQVPIVALTANAFAEDRTACLASGMNDFLAKPVEYTKLVATVMQWSGRTTPPASGSGPA